MLLQYFDFLRVSPGVEARGLDSEFGVAAYVHDSEKNQRLRISKDILEANGSSVALLLEALRALEARIFLPFAPQGSDSVLTAQVVSDV